MYVMCVRTSTSAVRTYGVENLFHGPRNMIKNIKKKERRNLPSPLTGVKRRARTSSTLYDIATLVVSLAALVIGGSLGGSLETPLVGRIAVGLLLGSDAVLPSSFFYTCM